MQKLSMLVIMVFFIVGICIAENETKHETEKYLILMFNYAKEHNVTALEQLKEELPLRADKMFSNAYSLALYIAAPEKYTEQYVETFPSDFEGIMYDFYERIELKQLTPSFLYSFESIGKLAIQGNDKAIGKVFHGYLHSDGVVAEMFCDHLVNLFDKQIIKAITALSQFSEKERKKEYSCFKTLETEELTALQKKLNKVASEFKSEIIVIQEMKKYLH